MVEQGTHISQQQEKSENESLTLRQCNAFTDDVPPFGLFIEQLQIFLVTTSDFNPLYVKQKQFNFYIIFSCLKSPLGLRRFVYEVNPPTSQTYCFKCFTILQASQKKNFRICQIEGWIKFIKPYIIVFSF